MPKQTSFQSELAKQNALLRAAARMRAREQREETLMLLVFAFGFMALISSPFWLM